MLNFAKRLVLLAFGILIFSACGQKGPLYMPNNPPPTKAEKLCPTCAAIAADSKNEEQKSDPAADPDSNGQTPRETKPNETKPNETTPNETTE